MLTFLQSSLRSDKKVRRFLLKLCGLHSHMLIPNACLVSCRQTACMLFNFGPESKWRPGILEVNLLNSVGGHLCPLTICYKHVDRSMGMELCLSPLCFNHSAQRFCSLSPDNNNKQPPALLNNTGRKKTHLAYKFTLFFSSFTLTCGTLLVSLLFFFCFKNVNPSRTLQ